MAGTSKKRQQKGKEKAASSSSRDGERRSTPHTIVSVPLPSRPGPIPGSTSQAGTSRPSPHPKSARSSTPRSSGGSSSGPRSLGAKFDGNRSRSASPAPGTPGSRPPTPGPSTQAASQVQVRNIDLGAGAWASINEVCGRSIAVQ